MKKRSSLVFTLIMGLSLLFGLTAWASPAVVSYGSSHSYTLTEGQGYAYILPNAKTTGTSVKITASAVDALRLHYYWSYNNTTVDLGTAIVNKTTFYSGSGYYEPGTLITVVERVPGSTTAYPTVYYTISFN